MSTNSIVFAPINYKIELKRLVVNEFRRYFNDLALQSNNLVDATTMQNVKCSLEYPLTAEGYPMIIIGYTENEVRSAGLSHIENDDNLSIERWIFIGDIVAEIFALTSLERDYISDNIVNLFSFGTFLGAAFESNIDKATSLYDVQANMKWLTPIPEQVMSGAAWGVTDSRIYTCGYSFPIIGAFTSNSIYEQYITGIDANASNGINTNITLHLPR